MLHVLIPVNLSCSTSYHIVENENAMIWMF